MSLEILLKHRKIWNKKPLIRFIYQQWYQEITVLLAAGTTIELCGGTGNLKEFTPGLFSSDVLYLPWMDAVINAEALPFKADSLANIIMVDGLHHIGKVNQFFKEASRVLRSGGRIILLEPYISPLSWPFYHFLHEEPVDFHRNPLDHETSKEGKLPFDANQAVATMLFEKDYERFQSRFPEFDKIIHRHLPSLVYPLSGGFGHPQIIPLQAAKFFSAIERRFEFTGRFLAFRFLVVLEKK